MTVGLTASTMSGTVSGSLWLRRTRPIVVAAASVPLPRVVLGKRCPNARTHVERTVLVVDVFAVAAATWAVLTAVTPVLQVRGVLIGCIARAAASALHNESCSGS